MSRALALLNALFEGVIVAPTKPIKALALVKARGRDYGTKGFWLTPQGVFYSTAKMEHSEWASRYLKSPRYSQDNSALLQNQGWQRGVLGYNGRTVLIDGRQPLNRQQMAAIETLGIEAEMPVVDANEGTCLYRPPDT